MSEVQEHRQGKAKQRSSGDLASAWWQRLASKETGDAGTMARLRRAREHLDVIQSRAAISLVRQLGGVSATAPDHRTRACLDLVRVLAHVREHTSEHPMRVVGWKRFVGERRESDGGEDRPLLSEARFRRLMQTGDGEEKVAAFVRLIAVMNGKANVSVLASDFLLWNHPEYGDRVRERWAFQYFAAGNASPSTDNTETEETAE